MQGDGCFGEFFHEAAEVELSGNGLLFLERVVGGGIPIHHYFPWLCGPSRGKLRIDHYGVGNAVQCGKRIAQEASGFEGFAQHCDARTNILNQNGQFSAVVAELFRPRRHFRDTQDFVGVINYDYAFDCLSADLTAIAQEIPGNSNVFLQCAAIRIGDGGGQSVGGVEVSP